MLIAALTSLSLTQILHLRKQNSKPRSLDLSENTQYAYVTGFQSYNRQFQLEPISTLK